MNQEIQSILARVDHTLLAQSATWNEIKAICDDGVKYGCASVCIPASYVKQAAEYVDGKIAICTVIGFPNGYDTTAAKCINLPDEMPLRASTDIRITWHERYTVHAYRENNSLKSKPGTRKCCLTARMSCTNYNNIIIFFNKLTAHNCLLSHTKFTEYLIHQIILNRFSYYESK